MKTRYIFLAVTWVLLGAYTTFLYSREPSRVYFGIIVVCGGLALANLVRLTRSR